MTERFVVLAHDWPKPHFDLMLERDGVLKTWRLEAEPGAGHAIAAEQIADHRLYYLDYEGPVSGHRGYVTRWDCGALEWVQHDDNQIVIGLEGQKLAGLFDLSFFESEWVFSLLFHF